MNIRSAWRWLCVLVLLNACGGDDLRNDAFPKIEPDPFAVTLNTVPIGQQTVRPLLLRNVGGVGSSLIIVGIELSNSVDTREVSITHDPLPVTLRSSLDDSDAGAGSSFRVEVTYAPRDEGEVVGFIRVRSNDPDTPELEVPLRTSQAGAQLVVNPFELDFAFRTPSPWTTPRHSFVTLRSAVSADEDCTVSSTRSGDTVTLDTTNVRGLELDGAALRARGVTRAVVDGRGFDVPEGPLAVGPQTGKRPGQHGPFNDVLQRPFCYVYATDDTVWQRYASFQVSTWAHIGNGTACALPIDAVTPMLRATYNLVYVGAQPAQLPTMPEGLTWDDLNVTLGDTDFFRASVAYVYPDGDRMTGVLSTAYGEGASLWLLQPFSSRGGMPDWLVYDAQGGLAAGFFDPEWAFR